jgi:hypothetical protein
MMTRKLIYLIGLSVLLSQLLTVDVFAGNGFEGTIKSIGKCTSKNGDKRFCKTMVIILKNGKEAHVRIDLDTRIISDNELYFDLNEGDIPQNKSEAEEAKEMEKVIHERLKPGTKVSVTYPYSSNKRDTANEVYIK